jgi:hypothetical protein
MATWSRARSTFGVGEPVTGAHFDQSGQLHDLRTIVESAAPGERWLGQAARAYGEKNMRHGGVIGRLADLDTELGSHVTEAARLVTTGRQDLESIRDWVLHAAQSLPDDSTREEMLMPIVNRGLAQVTDVISGSNTHLQAIGSKIQLLADDYADLGIDGSGDDRKADASDGDIQAVDHKLGPAGQAEDAADRRQNQIDAFRDIFGREPASTTDWATATALDPHSYDPNTDGVAPQIRVAKIDPVPGQGLVRVGQWIEQRDVISGLGTRDFGNARVADPHFDPANTKVTTYIDYENGLVVMRQNPSVELTADGGPGEVKVGVPEATIQQSSDGAVRIRYDAANPFAPGVAQNPPWPLGDNPWTVNGDLVFTPGSEGVRVDGTRTNYPSMEVYQDSTGGSTRTILIDPAVAGNSTGPIVNLPEHHEVGAGGSAFRPFQTGRWNSDFDVPIPLRATDLGPVAHVPVVPTAPSNPGVTQF